MWSFFFILFCSRGMLKRSVHSPPPPPRLATHKKSVGAIFTRIIWNIPLSMCTHHLGRVRWFLAKPWPVYKPRLLPTCQRFRRSYARYTAILRRPPDFRHEPNASHRVVLGNELAGPTRRSPLWYHREWVDYFCSTFAYICFHLILLIQLNIPIEAIAYLFLWSHNSFCCCQWFLFFFCPRRFHHFIHK